MDAVRAISRSLLLVLPLAAVLLGGCGTGLPPAAEESETLIQDLIEREAEILTSNNTELIYSVWCDDGVLYHGNDTREPADDYALCSNREEIISYYQGMLDGVSWLEYHVQMEELLIFGDTASCNTTGYITTSDDDDGSRDYSSFTHRPFTLRFDSGYWKISSITFYAE